MTSPAELEALVRLETERDRERKHVSRLMQERDHARQSLRQANDRIAKLLAVLGRNKTALEYASQCLNGITANDDEDAAPDGYSKTCRDAKRVVDSSLTALIRALSDKEQEK